MSQLNNLFKNIDRYEEEFVGSNEKKSENSSFFVPTEKSSAASDVMFIFTGSKITL